MASKLILAQQLKALMLGAYTLYPKGCHTRRPQRYKTMTNKLTSAALLVEARKISIAYGEQRILQQVDLSIKSGQIVTLIGPNGAGKTTLIKTALGLIAPDNGVVIQKPGLRIGYMPQRLHLDPSLPINVGRFLKLAHPSWFEIKKALADVGTSHLLNHPLQAISGGELQRVLLARALLRDPELLVLDEPVQGVDIAGQSELYALINCLRDRLQCGVLMVSHDLHLVMAQTDTVICLNQHVCCQGHPEQVSTDPAYLELFGAKYSHSLAVYQHDHDHEHDIHGNVIEADHSHQHSSHSHNTNSAKAQKKEGDHA